MIDLDLEEVCGVYRVVVGDFFVMLVPLGAVSVIFCLVPANRW